MLALWLPAAAPLVPGVQQSFELPGFVALRRHYAPGIDAPSFPRCLLPPPVEVRLRGTASSSGGGGGGGGATGGRQGTKRKAGQAAGVKREPQGEGQVEEIDLTGVSYHCGAAWYCVAAWYWLTLPCMPQGFSVALRRI